MQHDDNVGQSPEISGENQDLHKCVHITRLCYRQPFYYHQFIGRRSGLEFARQIQQMPRVGSNVLPIRAKFDIGSSRYVTQPYRTGPGVDLDDIGHVACS